MAEPFRILLREGTAAEWTRANPVLGRGEAGVEVDTQKVKFGDGTTAWNSIPDGIDVNTAALAEDPQSELNRVLNATFASNEYVQTLAYGTNLEATDSTVATWIPDTSTLTGQKLAAFFAAISRTSTRAVGQGELVVSGADYIVGDGVADDSAALLQAATDAGSGVLLVPHGTINVGAGLKLAGLKCSIIGHGADARSNIGTTFVASSQAGPVLDFTDFNWPTGYRSTITFDGFAVEGSGVADATKANSGIKVLGVRGGNNGGAGSVVWGKIVVSETGGPCIEADRAYLHDFSNIRLVKPVEAKANDVPYFIGRNISGCNIAIDVYSPNTTGADDCGVSGVVVLTDDDQHASTKNRLDIRAENLHPPTNGTIIHAEANENFIELRHFDCVKEAGATGTSFIRLRPPPFFPDYGGSEVVGQIPGDNGAAAAVDYGVDLGQSRNSVVGIKGFRGNNVIVQPGVEQCYVELRGARASATEKGIYDAARSGSNTLRDYVTYPGIGAAETARKPIDTARNNSTAAPADPHLYVQIDKNATYAIEAVLLYNSSTTADFKVSVATPAGCTVTAAIDAPFGGTLGPTNVNLTRAILSTGNMAIGGAGGDVMARISGTLTTGSTAGTVDINWGQLTAEATDSIMRAGSVLRVSRIA